MSDTDLFFSRTGMDRAKVQETVDDAFKGADDGELFLEYSQSKSFSYDDGRLKAASFDTSQGFGLRAVAGEATGYAHATELSEAAIARAARTVKAVSAGHSGTVAAGPARSNIKLYTDLDPLETAGFEKKVKLLEEMNAYARGKDSRVRQVSASLVGRMAADRDHPRRRRALFRHPPAGQDQCLRGGGTGRPPGNRQLWRRRPQRL